MQEDKNVSNEKDGQKEYCIIGKINEKGVQKQEDVIKRNDERKDEKHGGARAIKEGDEMDGEKKQDVIKGSDEKDGQTQEDVKKIDYQSKINSAKNYTPCSHDNHALDGVTF